jgi:hypothetical protein
MSALCRELYIQFRTLSDFILTHNLKSSNPLWLALSQALAFAYFPCSEVLHVKCRLLPEDLVPKPAIGVYFVALRRTELLPEDALAFVEHSRI